MLQILWLFCGVLGAIALAVTLTIAAIVAWALLVQPHLTDRRARRRAIARVIADSRTLAHH